MCCYETGNLLPACRVEGSLAKRRRHYGEPKGLSGKSSYFHDLRLFLEKKLTNSVLYKEQSKNLRYLAYVKNDPMSPLTSHKMFHENLQFLT